MLFAELAKQKSPAARVLLFPRTWTVDKGENADPFLGRTRRLMRLAARRLNVSLRPIEPIASGVVAGGEGEGKVDESLPSSYSLASLWELSEFERVLYLRGPGVLVDSEALDALLAFSELGDRPVAGIPAEATSRISATKSLQEGDEGEEKGDTLLSTSLLLINPSIATYHQLKQRRAASPGPDVALLRDAFPGPEALLSPLTMPYFTPYIHSTTPQLRRIPPAPAIDTVDSTLDDPTAFNATAFVLSTSYIHLNDPEMPGPEYDVPRRERDKWRPENKEARRVWERMYDVFRGRRMEVCGLDLEAWVKPSVGSIIVKPSEEGVKKKEEEQRKEKQHLAEL